jgi:hypothetical protein
MRKSEQFEHLIEPHRLSVPKTIADARKHGRECCGSCRTCVYHRPHCAFRCCVFRECPFVRGLSTSTYMERKDNWKKHHRRGKT